MCDYEAAKQSNGILGAASAAPPPDNINVYVRQIKNGFLVEVSGSAKGEWYNEVIFADPYAIGTTVQMAFFNHTAKCEPEQPVAPPPAPEPVYEAIAKEPETGDPWDGTVSEETKLDYI